MTTATGPEYTSPIEAENATPDAHENGTERTVLDLDGTERVVVGEDDECPEGPHLHAPDDDGASVLNEFFSRMADMASAQAETLKTMTTAEALSFAVLNFRVAQRLLDDAARMDLNGPEPKIFIKHSSVMIAGFQRQVSLALELRGMLQYSPEPE